MTSILISGTDLVGKTTLTNNLYHYLCDYGYSVTKNDHELIKTPLSKKALRLMINDPCVHDKGEPGSNLSLEINALLTMVILIDGFFFKPEEGKILIHDSYWQRIAAFNKVNEMPYISEILKKGYELGMIYTFDINILLTATLDAKRLRYLTKDKPDALDHQVFTDPGLVLEFEKELETIMQKEPNYFKINTTELDQNQVTKEVLKYVIPKIKEVPHGASKM